jgi:hypothetical protein
MDDDAKITTRQIGMHPDTPCYQYDEIRHLMRHSTEQMGHRAEAARASRFERLTP